MLAIPLELTNLIVQHWVEAVSGIPAPLEPQSSDFSTLEAASTAMGTE